jgi:low temperature requirement protein LtrA
MVAHASEPAGDEREQLHAKHCPYRPDAHAVDRLTTMAPRLILPARDPDEGHRASTPLELLFDLVIVIAIAALTAAFHHALAEGHGTEALPRFILLFITIWWAWMGVTWFASAFGHEDAGYKLLVGVIMTGALMFAAGAGSFFETMDLSWGLLGWSIMRLALAILWLRVARNAEHRSVALRFAGGIVAAQAAWFVLYFTTVPASGAAFAGTLLCLAIEFTLPAWAQSGRLLPWHRGHLTERYGLLMLIVLGEGLLAASFGFQALYVAEPDFHAALTGLSGVIIIFTLWWVYFDRDHDLDRQLPLQAFLWGYGHAPLFAAVALVGAGVAFVAEHPDRAAGWALGGPLAVACALIWALRDRALTLSPAQTLLLPIAALAFFAGGALHASAMLFAAISALLLAGRILLFPIQTPNPEKFHD